MKSDAAIPGSKLALPAPGRDHIQGPTDAPCALVEYGDYECPYCGDVFPVVKAIQEVLGERLCFAFRNFPLVNSHPHAEHAAEAAEAAAAHGRFWEMHDMLYENQSALEDEYLTEYAATLGLDAREFLTEIRTGAHAARIREDFKAGARAGVNGTPSFFINGVRYDGERDVEAMVAALASDR